MTFSSDFFRQTAFWQYVALITSQHAVKSECTSKRNISFKILMAGKYNCHT
jgi:hypothetical protein